MTHKFGETPNKTAVFLLIAPDVVFFRQLDGLEDAEHVFELLTLAGRPKKPTEILLAFWRVTPDFHFQFARNWTHSSVGISWGKNVERSLMYLSNRPS